MNKFGDQGSSPVTERQKMERNLKKLEKRGALDLTYDQKSHGISSIKAQPDPVVRSRPPKSPPGPSRMDLAMASKEAVANNMKGAAVYNAVRAGASAAKLAADQEHVAGINIEIGNAPDALVAGTSVLGAVAYGAGVYVNASKFVEAGEKAEANTKKAAANAETGWEFVDSEGAQGSGKAYIEYRKASEPIFTKRNGYTTTELDKQVFGANIPRYFANMIGALAGFANSVSKFAGVVLSGASTVAGAFGVVGGVAEIVVSAAQEEKALGEKSAAKSRQKGLDAWKKAQGNVLNEGLHRAQSSETKRREKLARRTVKNARMGFAKGSIALAVGITTIALSCIAVVATAGIAVAVIGGVVAAGFLGFSIRHSLYESKVAKYAERRQLQAQALAATHSVQDLEAMMASDDPQERKSRIASVQASRPFSTRWFLRKENARVRTVDVGQNGYVALHIQAQHLATRLGQLNWATHRETIQKALQDTPDPKAVASLGQETVDALRLLKLTGTDEMLIMAMCQAAMMEQDEAKRSALLRPNIARSLGLPWAEEKPLHVKAYLGPLLEVVQAQNVSPDRLDLAQLVKDFEQRVPKNGVDAFKNALTNLPAARKEHALIKLARTMYALPATAASVSAMSKPGIVSRPPAVPLGTTARRATAPGKAAPGKTAAQVKNLSSSNKAPGPRDQISPSIIPLRVAPATPVPSSPRGSDSSLESLLSPLSSETSELEVQMSSLEDIIPSLPALPELPAIPGPVPTASRPKLMPHPTPQPRLRPELQAKPATRPETDAQAPSLDRVRPQTTPTRSPPKPRDRLRPVNTPPSVQ